MNTNKQYLSVVQGNDFVLNMHVTKYNADNQSFIDYSMGNCSQVCVFLVAVTGGRRYKIPVTIDGNILTAEIDGSMLNVGVYGLELLFEDAESHSKRSYEPALIKIVRTNAEATYTQADFDSEDDCRLHITVQTNASFITIGAPTADTEIDGTSSNAVSNAAVSSAINNLQTQIDTIGSEILDPASVYTKDETEALIDTMVDPQEMADYVSNAVSNYTTKDEFENANKAISGSLNDLNTRISSIEENPVDLTAYVSKSELNAAGYITAQDVSSMGYATTQYVTDQIANIPATDLSSYVSKEELNAAAYLQSDDLSEYATQSFVSQQIEAIPAPDLSSYATKSFVSEQIAAIPQPDLSTYITETELNDTLSSYAKVSDIEDNERVVSTALNSLADRIESVEGDYVSSDELDETLLSYATKNYVDEKIDALAPSDLNEYVSKEYLSQQSYLQASALDGLATENYVTEQIEAIPAPDMSAYVTKTEINAAGYLQADDLSAYASKEYLSQQSYLQASALDGYATQVYVTEQIAAIPAPDMSAYVTKTELNAAAYLQADDLSAYASKEYLSQQAYVTETALDTTLSSYAKVSDIEDNEQVISTALNTLSDRIGLVENDYVSDDDLADYATKSYVVEKIDALAPSDLNEYVSKEYLSQQSYLQASALDGLATENYVTEQIEAIPAPDMSAYVSKEYLSQQSYLQASALDGLATENYVTEQIEAIPAPDMSAYVTKTELNTASYLQADDLSAYASKEYLSQQAYLQADDLNGYATQVYVTEQIAGIPAPDMSAYVSKTELNAAAYLQADDLTDYVTDSDLSSASYVTNTALNTTLASYTTKADVPYKFVVLSYDEYTALATKDPQTFYFIPEE